MEEVLHACPFSANNHNLVPELMVTPTLPKTGSFHNCDFYYKGFENLEVLCNA